MENGEIAVINTKKADEMEVSEPDKSDGQIDDQKLGPNIQRQSAQIRGHGLVQQRSDNRHRHEYRRASDRPLEPAYTRKGRHRHHQPSVVNFLLR